MCSSFFVFTIPHSNSLTVETLKVTGGPTGRGTDLIDTLNLFRKRYTDKDGKAFTLKDVEKIYIEGLTTAMTLREYNMRK